jgi:hypothetical protein
MVAVTDHFDSGHKVVSPVVFSINGPVQGRKAGCGTGGKQRARTQGRQMLASDGDGWLIAPCSTTRRDQQNSGSQDYVLGADVAGRHGRTVLYYLDLA